MKQIIFMSFVIILLAPLFSGSVWAGGGHSGGWDGWGHGGGGHFGGWHGGGGHFGYDLGLGLAFGYGPGFYGYGMPFYPYPYNPYPLVIAPQPAPAYTQQSGISPTSDPHAHSHTGVVSPNPRNFPTVFQSIC